MSIKNVIFDFGGVLLDWNPHYFYDDVFGDKDKAEWFIQNICTSEWNSQMDRGVSFASAIKQLQEKHPEYAKEIALYHEGWPKMLRSEIKDGVEILNKIKNSGKYTIYGLTNWSAETFPIAFAKYRFLDYFEGIVVSGEEEMIKPDKKIFHLLLERYHLKAEECLFIDDNAQNIETAKKLGIVTVHCVDFNKVRSELKEHLGLDF